MPNWKIKAAVQGALSRFPSPQTWNRVLQKHVTKTLILREPYFLEKWGQCQRHVANLRSQLNTEKTSFTALEIGTGWFPINSVGLALSGAGHVRTVDKQDLLRSKSVQATLRMYLDLIDRRVIDLPLHNESYKRLQEAVSMPHETPAGELLRHVGVESIISEINDCQIEDGWADLICSNNTLEHIPKDVIITMFSLLKRFVSKRGVMSHHIDLADHYADFDPTITDYNFLRYSSRTWAMFNNSIQWQNRLRISDYRDIHKISGWTVVDEFSMRHPVEIIRSVPLAQEFRRYTEEDLRVVMTWMTSVEG